ncbi:MAG: NPCBM/NEW2 domain-containing protein, partial [Clostridia bacterium]|nr:NPCBM/NEW2 domain-containing protein [Clostridia bacterium]
TPEEFAKGHLEGAKNLDYSKIATDAEKLFTDKNKAIVVYCSAAKRSAQAVDALLKLGYKAVYNLGSMDNFDTEALITFSTDTCKVITAGEKVKVNFTASPYDAPAVYVSCGKDSTLANAVPLSEFTVPDVTNYYLTLKAYLVQDGVCHAMTEKQFIFWSEKTVDAFASDMKWTEETIGWGSIHRDQSVNGNKLTLAGKNFAKGIGTHANSNIRMDIPKGATKFLAVAGCDLEMSGSNTMMFFVYIDGVEADHSSLIKIGQHYVFDVDIPEGAKEILLYAYEGTYGGNTNDHADWTVAGFINNPTEGYFPSAK